MTKKVAEAIQDCADWVINTADTMVWDVNYQPTPNEVQQRKAQVIEACETLQLLAKEALTRHIDRPEFEYAINRVNAAGYNGWHLDGRLIQPVLAAIDQQV